MNTRIAIGLIGLLAILIGGFYVLNSYIYEEKQAETSTDYKDATYRIGGESVTLMRGVSEREVVPGSASKVVTRYFGNEVRYDWNGDGVEDVAFLMTEESGGSGTFFYLVPALSTPSGYQGGEAMFIGDRIAPQSTEVDGKGLITVNYADRNPGEPMATPPSLGKSLRAKLDVNSLSFGEVVQDFEGEADPARMTLTMKTWEWVSASQNDGREVKPKTPGAFALTISEDGTVSIKTDCNSMGGAYTKTDSALTFGPLMSTKMYCEGSQEAEFAEFLTTVSGYHFTGKGELILDLKFDSGTMLFR